MNEIDENNPFSESPIWEDPISEDPFDEFDKDEIFTIKSNKEDTEDEDQSLPNKNECGSSTKSSFATDFYQCGTDWSRLKLESSLSDHKKLKQSNLFQMWGVKRNKIDENLSGKKMKIDEFGSHFVEKSSHLRVKSCFSDSVGVPNVCLEDKKAGSGCGEIVLRENINTSVSLRGENDFLSNQTGSKYVARKTCPFYKKMPGTTFTVDAFKYGAINGCSSYFLSHFHADHYGGLSKAWSHGPIYCTPITARLVRMCLSVNPSFIHPLDLDVEHVIDGIRVTLLEANHCPGATLIHFILPDGKCYLHTGDFRACKSMQAYPLLRNKRVDVLYLDTTYCNPKYKFPSKEEVLSFVVRTTKACLERQPKTLIIVGSYSIGKECVYIAISEALRVKIFANASRRRILQSFNWPQLSEKLCTNGNDTPLHVLPIGSLRHETLKNYLKTYQEKFKAVLAFRPTGWTFSESIGNQLDRIKPNSRGNIQIYGVPYSEHSSFTEMREFVQFLKPSKIIPTVNISNAANREKMQSFFRQWLNT